MKRLFVLLACLVPVFGLAADLTQMWLNHSQVLPSQYNFIAFAKENRIILARIDGDPDGLAPCSIVCLNAYGQQVWSYELGVTSVGGILTTSDDRIYVTTNREYSTVLALDQDGKKKWERTIAVANSPANLTEMRIFGSTLFIAGTGRTVANGTGPRSIALALQRANGGVFYMKEYLVNGQPYGDRAMLRATSTHAFLLARKSPSTASAFLKIDPATGDLVGSYVVGSYRVADFQVDSTGGIYSVGSLNGAPEMRKVNAGGAGAFPLVYRRPVGLSKIVLSGGAAFVMERTFIRKLRLSDGAQLWQYSENWSEPVAAVDMKVDPYGRICAFWEINPLATGSAFLLRCLNPTTGGLTSSEYMFPNPPYPDPAHGLGLLVSPWGELLIIGFDVIPQGNLNLRRALIARLAQPIEIKDDFYTIIEGTDFHSYGNGIMANDRYASPLFTEAYQIAGSGPQYGSLYLDPDGEFTYQAPLFNGPHDLQTWRYVAIRDNQALEAQVTFNVIQGLTFTLSDSGVAGPQTIQGTITLTSNGYPTPVTVSSDNPLVSTPSTVTVANSSPTASFPIQVLNHVTSETSVVITASLNGISKTRTLRISPVVLSTLLFDPVAVTGGDPSTLKVYLTGRAVPGGVTVGLSDTSAFASCQPSVFFPAGTSQLPVAVSTLPVTTNTYAYFEASLDGVTKSRSLLLRP